MVDVVSVQTRRRMMSGIKSRDTKPEIRVRSGLHRCGFRFRCNVAGLPGKPDMVFSKYKAVIQIHGCLWHQHDCHLFKWPCADNPTKAKFWRDKITANKNRDSKQFTLLRDTGWRIGIVWECALKGRASIEFAELIDELSDWLTSSVPSIEITGR